MQPSHPILNVFIVALTITLLPDASGAAVFTETFDAPLDPALWTELRSYPGPGGYVVPAAVSTDGGELCFTKEAETDDIGLGQIFGYHIQSNFFLQGDFTVTVDFNLVTFPAPNPSGWSNASFHAGYSICRIIDSSGSQYADIFGNGTGIDCSIMQGVMQIIRSGYNVNCWIIDGDTRYAVAHFFVNPDLEDVHISLGITQAVDYGVFPQYRSREAMEVHFDNLHIEAETIIIPEPAALLLLTCGVGLMRVSRRKQRATTAP